MKEGRNKKLNLILSAHFIAAGFAITSCSNVSQDDNVQIIHTKRIKQTLFKAKSSGIAIQENEVAFDFNKAIQENKLGKKQVSGNPDNVEYSTTYLGKLRLESGVNVHVVSQFYTVKAATSKHGHSKVFFFDKMKNILKTFELDLPDQLPVSIENNKLKFYLDGKKSMLEINALPEKFCLPLNNGCY